MSLLQHFDATRAVGERLRAAVRTVLREGPWTYDLAPEGNAPVGTDTVSDSVLAAYAALGDEPTPAPLSTVQQPAPTTVDAEVLHAWTVEVLTAVGVQPHHARDTADVLAHADLTGVDSHGTARLPAYVAALRSGVLQTDGEPTVERGDGAVALVDGHDLLGHPVSRFALDVAVERAEQHGIG